MSDLVEDFDGDSNGHVGAVRGAGWMTRTRNTKTKSRSTSIVLLFQAGFLQ